MGGTVFKLTDAECLEFADRIMDIYNNGEASEHFKDVNSSTREKMVELKLIGLNPTDVKFKDSISNWKVEKSVWNSTSQQGRSWIDITFVATYTIEGKETTGVFTLVLNKDPSKILMFEIAVSADRSV